MILKYGGSNFFCFKEHFEIDLRLNKNCPDSISLGKDFSQVMCIKGANASGKTTTLKAMSFLAKFITDSFENNPEKSIQVETFFNNDQPCNLFCEFKIKDTEYKYELKLNPTSVLSEKLTNLCNSEVLFFRKDKEIKQLNNQFSDLDSIPQLRSNASIISSAKQFEIESIKDIYSFFRIGMYSNVDNYGFREFADLSGVSKFYSQNEDCLNFVTDMLRKYDTGIEYIKIDHFDNDEGKQIYFPLFYFSIEGKNLPLRYPHQSSGTQRLYKILGWFYLMTVNSSHILNFHSVMLIDELDLHLHSKILQDLISLFQNNNRTQLIFTCQNDEIMNDMGKYRTVFINKGDNESFSYRLDELPSDLVRNNRPITPQYHKGKVGGVPNIG
jgi:predicted ATPase